MADTTRTTDNRPPYLLAALASLVVFAGYALTVAPSVTFWDDGEFVATAHILGAPHPPGTPLFVLVGHVWDTIVPFLSTAVKMNLMSALFSSAAAGLLFLFVFEALRAGSEGMEPREARFFRVAGGFAATLCMAFGFTVWQISTDAGKVYPIAMLLIAGTIWLTWLWRRERGGKMGAHILLLIVYLVGLALSNHLIGLLGGPALFAFMFHVLRTEPAREEAERRVQWAQLFVMVALWVTLVGLSIGNAGIKILYLGAALYLAATVWAFMCGTGLFAVVALVVAFAGLSTYTFLFVRAGFQPFINEADASTLRNLWAVIGREQYPPRSPFDNPMFPSGQGNPGRFFQPYSLDDPTSVYFTLKLIGLQFLNWIQYFDWQWASSLMRQFSVLAPARLPFTLLFIWLGVMGAKEHRKWDRSSFWLIAVLFLTTSLGLVIYLNFKPGFSLGLDWVPDRELHEVRERDYFFTISYWMWGLWAGIGILVLYRNLRARFAAGRPAMARAVLLLAFVPVALNFNAANRRYGPSAMLAHDFAYDMLIGVEPYGLLFTNGDNDTFPLWYLQEVEGVRQDVMIVNLSLVNTDWYIRQLRDLPVRPYKPDANALKLFGPPQGEPPSCSAQQLDSLNAWADRAHRKRPDLSRGRPMCLHMYNDDVINTMQPMLLPSNIQFRAGNITHTYRQGTPMYVKDIMVLRLIQENLGRRPIFFAMTAGEGNRQGLDAYVTQQGLAFKLWPDSVTPGPGRAMGPFHAYVDLERTRVLANDVYRYARLMEQPKLVLEPTDESIANNLAYVFYSLGAAYQAAGDLPNMIAAFRKTAKLTDAPELRQYLQQVEAAGNLLPGAADSGSTRKAPAR